MARAVRTAAVWCPDWPVTAAGHGPDDPVAVFSANRVVACSPAARSDGVRRGHRRREAQARCPELVVVGHDPDRDAREFEPVVGAVESLTPGVAVVVPGLLALRARGPARYFGGDEQVVELLGGEVAVRLRDVGPTTVGVGVADGLFAAVLAARGGLVVPPGESPEFLAPQDVSTLCLPGAAGAGPEREALVDLLRRLGLRTLGDLAALPVADVASRFDLGAVLAHRLAHGLDPEPVTGRAIPVDLEVELALDPPAERVETAAFAARLLAERLAGRLGGHGLACTRVTVLARTEAGEEHARTWRSDGTLDTGALADRTRWQLDGWLSGRAATRPTAGVALLRLVAQDVVEHRGIQLPLWGGWGEGDARAQRGLTRVQGMLGPEAVLVPVVGGGRGPGERVRLVPWQDAREPVHRDEGPWPGRLPAPYPSTVHAPPEPVELRDSAGAPVTVTSRQELSAAPAVVHRGLPGGPGPAGRPGGPGPHRRAALPVVAWAGPWTVDERWWDPEAAHRCARVQVVVRLPGHTAAEPDESALLLVSESGSWGIEGTYA